jgi:predicted alpha/beta superfamily hydrolase
MKRTNQLRLVVVAAGLFLLSCSTSTTNPNDAGWRFLPGHVEALNVPAFRGGRPCWIYLPPGYTTSDRRYPVLYVNDGDEIFDPHGLVQANRICEDLIRGGEIVPIIMVAISVPAVPDTVRFWEYAPWTRRFPFGTGRILGGGGDAYVRAVRDTLKPEVDRRFRTLSDSTHTGMAGYSLGGLISAYAGLAYGGTFGLVGACSPSYGWDGATVDIYTIAATGGYPFLISRYYQDTGYPADNYIGGMEQLLVSHGFIAGMNLMSITDDGATHSVPAWKHRFPDMLRFLFRP